MLWSSEEFGFLAPRRRLRHRQLDAAAEEEPRRGRAGPGQGRAGSSATSPACWPRSRACRSPTTATSRRTRSRCSTPSTRWSLALAALRGPAGHRHASTPTGWQAAADAPRPPPPTWPSTWSQRGMPFREAHAVVGGLVRDSLERRGLAGRPGGRRTPTSAPRRPRCSSRAWRSRRRTTPGGAGPAPVAGAARALPRRASRPTSDRG